MAIIGGGPAGLTLGRLLQRQGVQVKVYERDVNRYVRQQGSTLDLHYDTGLKAMEAAGLMEEFKKLYRPGADKSVIVDSQMQVLLSGEEENRTFGDPLFRPEIDRGPLRDMLIAALPEESIVWDARFVEMAPSGEGWNLQFENGISVYADLVIAADGANSKVRKYITTIPPVYSGVTDLEGYIENAAVNAPRLWQLVNGGSLFALGGGKTVKFITKGDGTLLFLIGWKAPENWLEQSGLDVTDKQAVAAWFAKEFADWSPEWSELFASDALTIAPRPWYHFPVNQHWPSLPNLTIIGDAAHRVPAYGGEGANQALADTVDLYESLCVEKHDTMQQAIAGYEAKMLQRMAVITEEILETTTGMHSDDNLQYLLALFAGVK
ncbi:monooxygenase [Filimonas lacunae]|nr:monooxygenase [Filimonas lacunae]